MEQALQSSAFEKLGIGLGAPTLRTDLLMTTLYHTSDGELRRTFMANTFPPGVDEQLALNVFDPLLEQFDATYGMPLRLSSHEALDLLAKERQEAPADELLEKHTRLEEEAEANSQQAMA